MPIRLRKHKYSQDAMIIFTVALAGALIGYVGPSNIGFAVAFLSVIYAFVRSNKNNNVALAMMFVLAYDFFGIVPWLSIGAGTLHWYDINVIFSLLLLLKTIKSKRHSKYAIIFLVYFVFILVACWQSMKLYSQGIGTTLASTRSAFVIIGYSALVYIIRKDQKYTVLSIFERITRFAIICYWIQFVLVNLGIDITYLPTKARWGVRVYINFIFIILYFFYHFYYLVYSKENIRKHISCCFISVLTLAVVSQSRSSLFFIAIIALITVLVSLKPQKILKYSLLSVLVLAALLSISPTRNIIISAILETSDNDTGSIAYRQLETQYYSSQLVGNELLGVGIPNKHDVTSLDYSGRKSDVVDVGHRSFNLTDLGAFKIRYQFGLIAYVLYFVMLIVVLATSFKKRSHSAASFAAVSMLIYLIIDSSMIEILTRAPFIMMLILIFSEVNFDECNKSDSELVIDEPSI